jgi:hypothetical protein
MKYNRVFMFMLMALLVLPAVVSAQGTEPSAQAHATTDSGKVDNKAGDSEKVIVYYFHGTRRCASCMKIEAYTEEAIDSAFADQLGDGSMEWLVINTDEEENRHYNEDYQLYTKSVVVSRVVDGAETDWKNLDKIWKLLGDKQEFQNYIRAEVASFIETE